MPKFKVKSTWVTIKAPYRYRDTGSHITYDYHSAHTIQNPEWRWWKPWIQRFISVTAGYRLHFWLTGKIELNPKPDWT